MYMIQIWLSYVTYQTCILHITINARYTFPQLPAPQLQMYRHLDTEAATCAGRLSSLLINNNTTAYDNVYGAVLMAQSHCKSSRGSHDECRLSAGWPPTQTKPVDLGCESAAGPLAPTSTIASSSLLSPHRQSHSHIVPASCGY